VPENTRFIRTSHERLAAKQPCPNHSGACRLCTYRGWPTRIESAWQLESRPQTLGPSRAVGRRRGDEFGEGCLQVVIGERRHAASAGNRISPTVPLHGSMILTLIIQSRCDAEPPAICSRCRRFGLDCVLASNPHARRTKAELQRELDKINTTKSSQADSRSRDSPAPGERSCLTTPPYGDSVKPSFANTIDVACSARVLDGEAFDAQTLKDCYYLFFTHYAEILPVVDSRRSPDQTYDLLPFLFWTIVFVGSRRYSKDRSVFERLSSRINSMALRALESRAKPTETIQGLLLLCSWPIPFNTMHKDISYVLSGAAMHLAMQVGLHVAGSGQDFARHKIDAGQHVKNTRAQLWIWCQIVCHWYEDPALPSLGEGISPLTLPEIDLPDAELSSVSPPDLLLRRKMDITIISATAYMARNLAGTGASGPAESLAPFISMFDTQLLEIDSQVQGKISKSTAIHIPFMGTGS
jgi:transcriptional regulatory protein LEU3